MHYHNAFEDERIIDELWVRRGTGVVRAQYNDTGVYTDWDAVMAYHRGRPHPVGKLILHYTTTPVIEVAADGNTAKGCGSWPASSPASPTRPRREHPVDLLRPREVDGRKIWAHWIWCKYGLDFLKQDDEWRILDVPLLSRSPARPSTRTGSPSPRHERASYEKTLAYFGDDGKPVFLPPVDAPGQTPHQPYAIDTAQQLFPRAATRPTAISRTPSRNADSPRRRRAVHAARRHLLDARGVLDPGGPGADPRVRELGRPAAAIRADPRGHRSRAARPVPVRVYQPR
jgi:hypothetical protein